MKTELTNFFYNADDNSDQVWLAYQKFCFGIKSTDLTQLPFDTDSWTHLAQNEGSSPSPESKEFKHLLSSQNPVYIPVPPLVHPAFISTIARELDMNREELVQLTLGNTGNKSFKMLRGRETGPAYVKELLSEKASIYIGTNEVRPQKLLIERVPVLPVKQRPFLEVPGEIKMPGVDNLAYQLLTYYANFLLEDNRYINQAYKQYYVRLQQIFGALCACISSNTQSNWWKAKSFNVFQLSDIKPDIQLREVETSLGTHNPPAYRYHWKELPKDFLVDILPLSDTAIWLQYPDKLLLFDCQNKQSVEAIDLMPLKLVDTTSEGRFLQFFGKPEEDSEWRYYFIHYDRQLKEWFYGISNDFNYVELSQELDERMLIHYGEGLELVLEELADSPVKFIRSSCRKFAWIQDKHTNGGIYKLETGLCQIYAEDLINIYHEDEVQELEIKELDDVLRENENLNMENRSSYEYGALMLRNDQWWLFDGEFVYKNGVPIFLIEQEFSCATFDFEGSRLLLGSKFGIISLNIKEYLDSGNVLYELISLHNKMK